jgi:hypothetical protein
VPSKSPQRHARLQDVGAQAWIAPASADVVQLLRSNVIDDALYAGAPCAAGAAVQVIAILNAMTEDARAATFASRCQRVNGALEGIEVVWTTVSRYGDRPRVFVSAGFATSHDASSSSVTRMNRLNGGKNAATWRSCL